MITGVSHITIAVRDVARSFAFYRDTLQFKALCKWPRGAYFLVGDMWFCLNQDDNRDKASADYSHIAFSVTPENYETVVQGLKNAGISAFKENISEGDSFYFLDPDGHKLEIHVGDWQSRIAAKKTNPWPDAEFFV